MSSKSYLKSEILYALYQLDPAEFENFIGKIWHRIGWETNVTDHFNDDGVDIVAHRDDLFSQKHLIQAKRFGPDKEIAKHTVEKYSNLKETKEMADVVIIITTSSFTESAEQRASELNVKLVDGEALASYIIKTESFGIVEEYSGENISSDLKENIEYSQTINDNTQYSSQNAHSHTSAESDICRTLTGLKWIKQSHETSSPDALITKADVVIDDGVWSYQTGICPNCGKSDTSKNGITERNPKGSCLAHPEPEGSVRIQRYRCNICKNGFSTKLPFIKDGYRYIDALRKNIKIIRAVSGLSIPMLQLICLLQFEVMPSTQTLYNWCTISTKEFIMNELCPDIYFGYYTYDEQILQLRNKKCYRLLLYDVHRRVPVAEQIVDSVNKDVIRRFLQTAIKKKSCKAITTDGRPGIADIVENDIGVGHYRCLFHLLDNFEDGIDRRLKTSRPSDTELVETAIIGSKFKQIFESDSYSNAIQNLESVKENCSFLPKYIRKYIDKVDKNRAKFLGYMKNPKIPRTIKSCERYFSHTQTSAINEKSLKIDSMQSFLMRKMVLRTVREGLIPHDRSAELIQENYVDIEKDSVRQMYTERKKQFLEGESLLES